VRRRRGRKRAIGARAPLRQAQRPNQIWVLDFMSDVLETGRRFRVFNVEDQLTREGRAAEVDTSLPGPRVVRTLNRIVAERGKPEMIVSDNGTELTGNAMLKWAEDNSVEWHLGRQRVGPLRYSGPPRPVPLPERPPQGKLRTDSTYDWREIGEQVMGN